MEGKDPIAYALWLLALGFCLWLFGASLSGCSRRAHAPAASFGTEVRREALRVADSLYRSAGRADSTYVLDSVRIVIDTRRDTAVRTEYRYRTHWRERTRLDTVHAVRLRRDTVYLSRRDSVAAPLPAGRGPAWRERFFASLGRVAATALALMAALWAWKARRGR